MQIWVWLAIICLLLLIIILFLMKKTRAASEEDDRVFFERINRLMPPRQRGFMALLSQAVGEQFVVFPKVSLAQLVFPLQLEDGEERTLPPSVAFSSVDYVLCSKDDLAVIAAIQVKEVSAPVEGELPPLDPVEDLLADVDISMAHFDPRKDYTPGEIQKHLADSLSLPMKVFREASHQLSEAIKPKTAQTQSDKNVKCPLCESPMAQRRAKQGKYAGRLFWVCSSFPQCKKILPVKS